MQLTHRQKTVSFDPFGSGQLFLLKRNCHAITRLRPNLNQQTVTNIGRRGPGATTDAGGVSEVSGDDVTVTLGDPWEGFGFHFGLGKLAHQQN